MARTKLTDLYKSLYDIPLHEQMSPETLMVKLGGDEKTELRISNQTDSNGAVDLSNVTLEFKGEKYEGLNFEFSEVLEDHENEGKDALFVAESDDKMFEVEVNIDANYDQSGIIDDVEWRSLETFPIYDDNQQGIEEGHCYGEDGKPMPEAHCMEENISEKKNIKRKDIHRDVPKPGNPASSIVDEAHCTEQEIEEGTCGYAQDGKVDVHNTHKMKPASSIKIISLQERFKKLANIKK